MSPLRLNPASGPSIKWVSAPALLLSSLLALSCNTAPRELNLLLISVDTLRADHLGSYGYDKGPISPNLDRLAREGVAFERVISPAPLTLPAHASMLSGLYPPRHGVHDNLSYRLGADTNTLAELLAARGYDTAGFVSSVVLDSRYGIDQGFAHYDDDFEAVRRVGTVTERSCSETVRRARNWFEEKYQGDDSTEPFFAFVHLYDPHDTYLPPSPHAEAFPDSAYAGEVAFADACIGELVDALERQSLLSDTLIVATGDHGEMLGEHGEQKHGFFVYQAAVSVPLIWRMPGAGQNTAGSRISETVSLVDVFPTILSLLGFGDSATSQGENLEHFILEGMSRPDERRTDGSREVYTESLTANRYYDGSPLFALVTDRWKYIHSTRTELYDLNQDPEESANLVDQQPRLIDGFQRRLDSWLSERGRAESAEMDDAQREALSSLGYLGGASSEPIDEQLAELSGDPPIELIGFYERHQTLEELSKQSDWEQVSELARQMLNERPSFKTGFLHLARAEHEQGRPEAAIEHYRSALELDDDDGPARLALADELRRAGDIDGAVTEFERALEKMPGHVEARMALAALYVETGQDESARRVLEETMEQADASDPAALVQLGKSLAAAGETHQAKSLFRDAIAAGQGQGDSAHQLDARMHLASTLMNEGNPPEAERVLRPAEAFAGARPEVKHMLGLSLRAQGRLDEAADAFEAALSVAPSFAPAHNDLGLVHKQRGDSSSAQQAYERAIEIDPGLTEAHNNLGSLLGAQGKMVEATQHFRRAIATNPNHAESRNNLGLALRLAGQRDEALEHFRVALQRRPDWAKPMSEIAWILATHPTAGRRSPNQSIRLAERAVELTREQDPIFLDTLAAAYASNAQFGDAVRTAQKAVELATRRKMRGLDEEMRARLSLYRSGRAYRER